VPTSFPITVQENNRACAAESVARNERFKLVVPLFGASLFTYEILFENYLGNEAPRAWVRKRNR
jgi:hypothetical protein